MPKCYHQKLPLVAGDPGPQLNTQFLGLPRVHIPNGISIDSSIFAQLTLVTNRHTHRPHYMCNNRRHLLYSMHCARAHTRTHTHTCLTALFPGLPGRAGTRKVKPIWILLKQETVSGSGISWATCKSVYQSREITTPAPHHSVFLLAGCPSCHPTSSVTALKSNTMHCNAAFYY